MCSNIARDEEEKCMKFEQLNPGACRTYLLSEEDKNQCVLIDPVIDHVGDYLELLKKRQLTLTHVVDTHTHADHISAGPSLKDATECEYVMQALAPPKCVTIRVKEGDELELAGRKAKVIETPGHTRDSISLVFEDMILTGDFLFLEDAGAGRDDLPGGNAKAHYDSIQKLEDLSGDLMVYPAHEYRHRKPSTLAVQREKNPHLQMASEEAFVMYIDELKLGPAEWMRDVLNANYKCAMDPNAAWIPTDVPACEIKGTMNPNAGDIEVSYISHNHIKEGTLLIDVREKEELTDPLGHIKGVKNIPIGQLTHRIGELSDYINRPVVVICRSGARATTGAQILITGGFTNVKVLDGGMIKYRSLHL